MALTGTELINRVRYACDIESNTARHPDTSLLILINQSIAAYRRLLSRLDITNYATYSTVSTVSNTSVVSAPAAEEILSMTITLNTITTTMFRAGEFERAMYRVNGRPASYSLSDRPTASGVLDIQLFPTPDNVYTINLHYVPTPVDITTATSWYPEVRGGEDWVVYDVACKIATRDAHPRLQALMAERSRQEALLNDLAFRQREAGHRTDTRGQRRMNELLAGRRS